MASSNYAFAHEFYGAPGVDTEKAIATLASTPISVHCWQGDDISGFESTNLSGPGGGLAVTGYYPRRARNPQELRTDLDKVFSLVPGKHRVNLHAFYLENNVRFVDRHEIETSHFQG